MIPARIIHNWDFTPYPVCTVNKRWLDTVMQHPLLDIRLVNPKLYQHIEDLAELQVNFFVLFCYFREAGFIGVVEPNTRKD